MAKYFKFHYDAGYIGTDVNEVFKFDGDISDNEVEDVFDNWYDEQRSDNGSYEEISQEEAEELGIDDDLSESEE